KLRLFPINRMHHFAFKIISLSDTISNWWGGMLSRFCNTLEREIKHANSINAVCLNNFLSHTENKK
ncbi:hypothetical protein NQU39_26030, partial [Escherichia coli]|uniref:hypothetical protein n=1 Tax=Escherichia coli TaxID=562 RepID=UPI0021187623